VNERREQPMTDRMQDETTTGSERTEHVVVGPSGGQPSSEQLREPARATGGVSTAEMADAMDRRGNGGTREAATAMERRTDGTTGTAPTDTDAPAEPLFSGDEAETFRSRWTSIQAGFVDEPRQAVEQADSLVAEVIQRLAQVFAEERSTLEQQWGKGDNVDTEGLRVALRRYRSFFERLLSA